MKTRIKIGIVVSHPIQHFCPQYRSLAENPDLEVKVFFASKLGVESYNDAQFNLSIKWERLYLENFPHIFLNQQPISTNKNLDAQGLELELDKFKPDFILTYGYYQKVQKRAYNWAKLNNIPILYVSDSELLRYRFFGKSLIKKVWLNKYFKGISGFLSVGDANEEYYSYYGVPLNKMFRTFFPVDIFSMDEIIDKQELSNIQIKETYNIHNGDKVILTVGKLLDYKNHLDVINSLSILDTNESITIHYLIVGDGPEKENLKKHASRLKHHKVHFVGFIQPHELYKYYCVADIYVHPSTVDAHSLSISEAIYAGCPILVSSNCGSYGPTDDVQHGYNGYVYEVMNSNSLASKILYILKNNLVKSLFSHNSRKLGLAHQKLAHGEGLLKAIRASVT